MRAVKSILLICAVSGVSAMQSPEPPLSDTRLTVHTLVREDVFAGFMAGDMARFGRGERNIETLLKDRPADRANLLAWKAAAQLYRAVLAHEASKPAEFEQHFAAVRDGFAEAAKRASANDGGVTAITGGTFVTLADRLPQANRAWAWAQAYAAYSTLWQQQGPGLDKFPPHFSGEVLSGMAMSAQRTGRTDEAAQFVEKINTMLPNTAYQAAATQWKSNPDGTVLTCKSCHAPGRLAATLEALKKG
jgi:hypothetical protein